MAVSFCQIILNSPLSLTCPPLPSRRSSRTKICNFFSSSSSFHMDLHKQGDKKFMEFPFALGPQRDLMVDLVSTLENRLDSQLLPCTLPLDVQHCQNESGTGQASLHVRSGRESSLIDFILGSWLHCELPNGAALNITSLSAYLNSSTDAPNFIIELINSSPTSLIFILDLPPRKDLVLHPDYLLSFYEVTQLNKYRQMVEKLPEVQPYNPSSLYLRCVFSPTAIMGHIQTDKEGPGRLEEVIKNHVHPIAKEVFEIWLDHCAFGKREVGDEEKACLKERDGVSKSKTIEIDLGTNFPRLFGPEIAARVLGAIQEVYKR